MGDAEDKAAHAKAVKVIGGHKAQITRAMVTVDKVLAKGSVLAGEVTTVKSAKLMIEKQVQKIESQIDALLGNDNFAEEELNGLTDYILDKGNILEQVSLLLDYKADPEESVKAETSLLDVTNAISESMLQVQSRQISQSDLPTFNGEDAEYLPFMEAFDYLVDGNENIPDAMKANHLKKCILEKGPKGQQSTAYDLVKHISPKGENYKLMRERLDKRFKLGYKSRALYISNLRKLTTWKPCHSATEVRKLLDYITENLELLKLAGGKDVSDNDFLLTDVLGLLPGFIVNKFLELDLEHRTIERLITNAEDAVGRMFEKEVLVPKPNKGNNNTTNKHVGYNSGRNTNKPHWHSFSNSSYHVNDENKCMFCGGKHSSLTCHVGSVHDRLAVANEQIICHNCLENGHYSAYCNEGSHCKCQGGRPHCQSLCLRNNQKQVNHASQSNPNSRGRGSGTGSSRGARGRSQPPRGRGRANNAGGYLALPADPDTNNNALADAECFMEIATAYVESAAGDADVPVRLFLDSGSNASFGEEEKINQLKREVVGARNVNVSTLGGNTVGSQDSDIVKLLVKDRKNFYKPTEITISVLSLGKRMVQNVQTWPLTEHQARRISGYQLSDQEQVSGKVLPIDILIGLDHYWKFMHKNAVDPGFGPMLRFSKLGWILSGQRDCNNPRLLTSVSRNPLTRSVQTLWCNTTYTYTNTMSDKLDQESVYFAKSSALSESSSEEEYNARFSDLETFGIKPDEESSTILDDFNSSITFNNQTKRFKVKLPLIERFLKDLDDGYKQSKVRLDSLFSKFKNPDNAQFREKYYAIVEEQERDGVIERVSDISPNKRHCTIPHHGVLKGDKLRAVYDGSYKTPDGKTNINDCLNPGPPLNNELIEMLMRLRIYDVVLTGDIQKAFLQIEVDEAHRDYLRFLWYDRDGKLVTYRFTRVPFRLTSSSFLLNATLRYHMQKRCQEEGNSDMLALLSKAHYVDDWILGAKTPEEVIQIKLWLTEFLEEVGMKLHKFNSNSEVVRQSISAECPEMESVLGLPWNTVTDQITVNVERAISGVSEVLTKQQLYSAPPRIFDPLGFLQPFMFKAKLLFQETCKLKLKWKGQLPPDIREKFNRWLSQWPKLLNIKIPRQVVVPNYDFLELHGFGDASKLGYCACIYIVSSNSSVRTSRLVISKTRVAPLKEMSIPRLELTAAFLLARLMAIVIKFHDNLKFTKTVYYSDSTTALQWIRAGHKQWTTYVDNRVRDINLLSSPADWKYVPTEFNPSDKGTRGIDADELVDNDLWFSGPKFLVSGHGDVPHDDIPDMTHPTEESMVERKKMVTVVMEKTEPVVFIPKVDGSPRKLADYSSINKVFNITGYLYRFIYIWLGEERFARFLGYEPEIDDGCRKLAEERWIRYAQMEHYEKEIIFCRDHPKVIPSGMKVASSIVQQLGLFLDPHDILRVKSRLSNATVPGTAVEPMLLPKRSQLTVLLIWRTHFMLKCGGVGLTLAEVRQSYWIPQGRQVIRNVLRPCVKCRMALAGTFPVLAPPDLPDFRVQRVEVFANVGVDFAGPLYIQASLADKIKGRREAKKKAKKGGGCGCREKKVVTVERMVYLAIFTCAVSRNVHAEVLDGMSVTDFMHGLRRFVSKYGPPTMFYSDNAKTFECVSRELPQVLNNPKLHKYLHDRGISWKFYVQKSPWMGGFIERVVGLFKSAVKRVVGRALLDFQEFLTLIYEINAVLNSRPISYVYDTVGEEEPITPSKLWCGKNIVLFPPFYEARLDNKDPEICKKRLKYLDKLLTHFWNRFCSQYLSSLSERHFSRNLPRNGRQPKVGEVVLIKNDLLPRGRWKIAQVVEVTPGSDGIVRRVALQPPYKNLTPDTKKNKPSELIYRPPRLLVPLECEVDKDNLVDVDGED